MPDAKQGNRVLVVDDEANIVEVISMALRYQGFDVETAAHAAARRSPRSPASNRI